jgi:hypothetical protein
LAPRSSQKSRASMARNAESAARITGVEALLPAEGAH